MNSNSILAIEPVVTSANACYNDYLRFSQLPKRELDSIQKNYYADLHALQNELTNLLNEIRDLNNRYTMPYTRSA